MQSNRKIIHIDMDCFYAAVEMRDNPSLIGKPIGVGGPANKRGVLCTCNYEARQYGVRSAMPTRLALEKCPELIILPVNMSKYKSVSQKVFKIFKEYTPLIEPLSLDEAYLDVSNCHQHQGSATLIAQAIRKRILQEEGLTASAGIAPNKLLAKIASDLNKPNGQFVIRPQDVDQFVLDLPVRKLHGVGKVTFEKLQQLNIETCGDLQKCSYQQLSHLFGRMGEQLYQFAHGHDNRPVNACRQRKSISVETTFEVDLDPTHCPEQLHQLIAQLKTRIAQASQPVYFNKIFIKIKFNDFTQTTVEKQIEQLELATLKALLLTGLNRHNKTVRLLGIGVRLKEDNLAQTDLFYDSSC